MCEWFHIRHNEQSSSLMTEIRKMYDHKLFTDVIIVADQEEFRCHKLILAASSSYFKIMFSSSFKENLESRVYFNSLSPWSMKCIIDFVYTGECCVSIPHVQELLQAATMLEYPVLVYECAQLMAKNIDIENCFALLSLSVAFDIKFLDDKAREFIRKNFTQIGQTSPEWLNLKFETILECISDHLIDVRSEREVWSSAMRWISHDIDSRIEYLPVILDHIRLHQLDRQFVQDELKESTIIQKCQKSQQLLESFLSSEFLDNEGNTQIRPSTVKKPSIVLLGGMDHFILNRVDSYNPSTNEWTSLASLPENNVLWFSSCVLGNRIYILGGIEAGTILDRVYMYDSKSDIWYNRQKMLCCRAKHATASIDKRMFVTGGFTLKEKQEQSNIHTTIIICSDIDLYDENTDQWTHLVTISNPRVESCLVPVLERKSYGDPDEPIISTQWYLYEIGGYMANDEMASTDQISIFRVDKDNFIEPQDYYIKLPSPIKNAKCSVDQTRATVYIFWETTGKLARLNIETNSIHFLPENPYLIAVSNNVNYVSDNNNTGTITATNNNSLVHCGLCYLEEVNSLFLLAGSSRCHSVSTNNRNSVVNNYHASLNSQQMFKLELNSQKWTILSSLPNPSAPTFAYNSGSNFNNHHYTTSSSLERTLYEMVTLNV